VLKIISLKWFLGADFGMFGPSRVSGDDAFDFCDQARVKDPETIG
jgi:hypothetical protein